MSTKEFSKHELFLKDILKDNKMSSQSSKEQSVEMAKEGR